jgi:hypothetical protein
VLLNPTAAQVAAALGGQTIQSNWNTGEGSFNNAAFDYQIDVTYTQRPAVPEPPTLGLMCSALVGLGFLARRKK